AARERYQGVREVLGSASRVTVLDGQWTDASAEAAVRSWLRLRTWEKDPVHAVAAQDDSMARGAQTAIDPLPQADRRAWEGVKFPGIDGVAGSGQKLVEEGRLHATIVMPSNAGPALELLHRWLRTGKLPPPHLTLPATSYPTESRLKRTTA